MRVKYAVALLLFLMFAQGFISASLKSRTIDEIPFHLGGGYGYLTTGRQAGGIENPPLSPALVSIPLLFIKDKSRFNNFDKLTQLEYIYETKKAFDPKILLISRIVPLILMIILGYLIFLWARDLYGAKAALLALFLYSFSPNMLAFGGLVTADMAGALFIFLSMYAFWKYVNKPTKKSIAIASLCFGLALASKMFSIFLIPTFILYSIIIYFLKDFNADFLYGFKREDLKKASDLVLSLLIIIIIGLFMLNSAYFFDGTFTSLKSYNKDEFRSSTFRSLHENRLLNWIPMPLPKLYIMGHDNNQWAAKDEKRFFFFWGKLGERFKSYYAGHILIKTPIPIFIFIILGFLYFRRISLSEIYFLIFIFLILFSVTFLSKLAIGYRHVLSIYPFFYLFSCRILKNGIPKNRIIAGIIAATALWYLIGTLLIFPHYLAYFNEFIGGPKNGYKYTIDSNLDWEQDLDLVKKYLRKNIKEDIKVDPGCQPVTGKILVPANSLQFQKWVCYTWLKQSFEPVDYIGYSWLVYDIKGQWVKDGDNYRFIKQT